MKIQAYSADQAKDIADLFHQSVHAIDVSFYNSEQKKAWAASPIDYDGWADRLSVKKPFVAMIEGSVAGFIELDDDGHIDCVYTHPEFQGRGVASSLYEHLLTRARDKGMERLYLEASYVARPFFERRGFSVIGKNEIQRNGVVLVNYSMEKQLNTNK